MNLSDDPDYKLTFEWYSKNVLEKQLSSVNNDVLWGRTDPSYFKNNPMLRQPQKPKNPLTKILDWYDKTKIKPTIKTRDFNSQGQDPMRPEDNEKKTGIEIGFKTDF